MGRLAIDWGGHEGYCLGIIMPCEAWYSYSAVLNDEGTRQPTYYNALVPLHNEGLTWLTLYHTPDAVKESEYRHNRA